MIAIVSAGAYFREHSLHEALKLSEKAARQSEQTAQLNALDNLLLAGDSLAQSKHYAEAASAYDEAWRRARALSQPTIAAVSGLLQVRGESPPPLVNRRPTTRLSDGPSPLTRVRIAPSGEFAIAGDAGGRAFAIGLPLGRSLPLPPMRDWATGICFVDDGRTCVIGSAAGELLAWDVAHWDHPREQQAVPAFIYALTSAPDGRSFASGNILCGIYHV